MTTATVKATQLTRGDIVHTLPDAGTVTVTTTREGVEYGDLVIYVEGTNRLGQQVTRWVPASRTLTVTR